MIIRLARSRYSIISLRDPTDGRQKRGRFSLQAGSNFFFPRRICQRYPTVSLFLRRWCFARDRLSPFTRESARQWVRIIPRGKGRTFSPGCDVSPQRLKTQKKPAAKGHDIRDRKKKSERERERLDHRSRIRKWLDSTFRIRGTGISGDYSAKGYPAGDWKDFIFFCSFEEVSCMAPPSRSWDTLFHAFKSSHLKLALESFLITDDVSRLNAWIHLVCLMISLKCNF